MKHKSVFVIGGIILAIVALYFIKRKEISDYYNKNTEKDNVENFGTMGNALEDENLALGVGEGTFGFGRYGSSFMA